MCQQAPQNLEFYSADIDFEDLHGLQDTAGKIDIWILLKPIGRSGLRADGFSILVLLVFLRDKILLCYLTGLFLPQFPSSWDHRVPLAHLRFLVFIFGMCVCISVHCMHIVAMETRRGHQIP